MEEKPPWVVLYGKCMNEWRGTAIVYKQSLGPHHHTQVHTAGITTTLYLGENGQSMLGIISGHIPWNATITLTEEILANWEGSHACRNHSCVLGLDANESFKEGDTGFLARSGRGNAILDWATQQKFRWPPQHTTEPSHYPYNHDMAPRRLDYLATKGGYMSEAHVGELRDIARSDHEPIIANIPSFKRKTRIHKSWGARTLRDPDQILAAEAEAPQGHTLHERIKNISQAITMPLPPTASFQESAALKDLRAKAHGTPPGAGRKQAWKEVQKVHKMEHRQWEKNLIEAASKMDWKAMRAIDHLNKPRNWEFHLLDSPNWQQDLRDHFASIFHKSPSSQPDLQLAAIRHKIRSRCKVTPWRPFEIAEMQEVTLKWEPRKATGPDGISHEAIRHLLTHPTWSVTLKDLLDDALYMGKFPSNIADGITVLLPKKLQPEEWSDTRPITLSSTLLKWAAQLLLLRGGSYLTRNPCQFAAPHRQSTELIYVLRRVVRMSKDWGETTFIVKLDIQKAFDSVSQPAMADIVYRKIAVEAQLPWEANLWIDIIQARELHIAVGDAITIVAQSNGVRQGSPDSPVLFADLVGEVLEDTLQEAGPPPQTPPSPMQGAGFMDDTYLWSNSQAHPQRLLTILDGKLRLRGLHIHPKKTGIIASHPEGTGTPFRIGGETVLAKDPSHILNALGSPLAFDNGTTALAAEMHNRARKTFHLRKKVLCADTPICPRLILHNTYVRSSALWACGTWPPQECLLKQANSLQLTQIRNMLGKKRLAGETWTDWNTRSLRAARTTLHKEGITRWSTFILRQIWGLNGHIARGPVCLQDMLRWKGISWWRQEQQQKHGARRARRFNPHLDIERHLVAVAGLEWISAAHNRTLWESMSHTFIARHDPPWTTGRQTAIHNLATNRTPVAPPVHAIQDRRDSR